MNMTIMEIAEKLPQMQNIPGSEDYVNAAYRNYNEALSQMKAGKLAEAKQSLKTAIRGYREFEDAIAAYSILACAMGNPDESRNVMSFVTDPEKRGRAEMYCEKLSENESDEAESKIDAFFGLKKEEKSDLNVRFAAQYDAPETSALQKINERVLDFRLPEEEKQPDDETVDNVVSDADTDLIIISDRTVATGNFPETKKKQTDIEAFNEDLETDNPGVSTADYNVPTIEYNDPAPEQSDEYLTGEKEKTPASLGFGNKLLIFIIILSLVILLLIAFNTGKKNADDNNQKATAGISETADIAETATAAAAAESPSEEQTATPGITEGATETPTELPTETPSEENPEVIAAENYKQLETYYNAGNYEAACRLCSTGSWAEHLAEELKPGYEKMKAEALSKFTESHFTDMYACVSKNEWEKALEYALALIELNPDYERGAEVYFHAGKACEMTGDTENALTYYSLTVEKYPDTEAAEWAGYRQSQLK